MIVFECLRVLAVIISFAVFLKGFFPLKNSSRGFSTRKIVPKHGFKLINTSLDFDNEHEDIAFYDGSFKREISDKILRSENLDIDIVKESNLSGIHSVKEDEIKNILPYKRLIILVIDALRTDFMYGPLNYMPKTNHLLKLGHGLSFIGESHPPTVTLPRIKAITTGSIPNFFDVVLNFGSTAIKEDNIITQMKINKKRIVFYGDDTWIHLFPNHFERADGTTSFFVMDYTEVDNNVTRHLQKELENDADWDVMILHYLGLDHIGHFAGPKSPLVRPKLAEMDQIIARMYAAIENWSNSGTPSLLVIFGDHGMSDQGGHGGSTPAEISVPVVFLSPHIHAPDSNYRGTMSQTDLCPTLSVLLGIPVPMNNLGKVIVDTLVNFNLEQKLSVLHQNFLQVMSVFKSQVRDIHKESAYLLYKEAQEQYQSWLDKKNTTAFHEWEKDGQIILIAYTESLQLMAEKVGKISVQYDVYAMGASIVLLWLIFMSFIVSHLKKEPRLSDPTMAMNLTFLVPIVGSALMTHITMCTVGVPSNLICSASPLSITVQITVAGIFVSCMIHILTYWGKCIPLRQQILHLRKQSTYIEGFIIFSTIIHTFSLLSSSFVEEEHQTFYFFTISVHLLLVIRLAFLFLKQKSFKKSIDMRKSQGDANLYDDILDNEMDGSKGDSNDGLSQKNSEFSFPTVRGVSKDMMHQEIQLEKEIPSLKRTKRKRVDDGMKCNKDDENVSTSAVNISRKETARLIASLVVILVFLRFLRMWNQTGNKWLHIPDFGDWLVLPQNKGYLSIAVIFSLFILGTSRGTVLKRSASMYVNLSLVAVYLYRSATGCLYFPYRQILSGKGIVEARVSYFLIGFALVMSLLPPDFFSFEKEDSNEGKDSNTRERIMDSTNKPQLPSAEERKKSNVTSDTSQDITVLNEQSNSSILKKDSLPSLRLTTENKKLFERRLAVIHGIMTAWLSLMCLLLRPHNIPIVTLLSLIEQIISHVIVCCRIHPYSILIYCLWMGHAFFFFQGNSNSISTVDVSAGYVGLEEYNPVLIGLLIGASTYAGPIFWLLAFVKIMYLSHKRNQKSSTLSYRSLVHVLMLKLVLPLAVYSALVAAQRYHLFVWTVFSPKLLYLGAETLCIISISSIFFLLSANFSRI